MDLGLVGLIPCKGGGNVDAESWISAYAEQVGTAAPTGEEFQAILDLAAEAAHSSERIAAPVACWVAAKSGLPLTQALTVARAVDGNPDTEGPHV